MPKSRFPKLFNEKNPSRKMERRRQRRQKKKEEDEKTKGRVKIIALGFIGLIAGYVVTNIVFILNSQGPQQTSSTKPTTGTATTGTTTSSNSSGQKVKMVQVDSRKFNFKVASQGRGYCPTDMPPGSTKLVRAKTRVECTVRCVESKDGCLHASFDADNDTCTHFYLTPARMIPEPNCNFYVNRMKYDGCFGDVFSRAVPNSCQFPFTFNKKQYYSCTPINGATNSQCILANGDVADCITPLGFVVAKTLYKVNVGTFVDQPLPCIANWFIMMTHASDGSAFDVDWVDYKNGFGNYEGIEFWIGLEKIYQITNAPGANYMLRVEVQTLTGAGWYFAEYSSFSIDSEQNQYTMHLSGYTGNAGDSLTNASLIPNQYVDGQKFSTPDIDNDIKAGDSCAQMFSAGWWFGNCYYACLTCPRSTSFFSWYTLNDMKIETNGLLRTTRMLIRKI